MRRAFWVASLLLLLPHSSDARWNLSSLPQELSTRVHFRAAEVPAFAHTAAWLDDFTQWPESLAIGGWVGYRNANVMNISGDVVVLYGRALPQDKPWQRLRISYIRENRAVGPAFAWSRQLRVLERAWFSDSVFGAYSSHRYYGTGELQSYSTCSGRGVSDPITIFKEHFDRKGNLVGASFEPNVGGARASQYFWKGKEVTQQVLHKKLVELFRKEDRG